MGTSWEAARLHPERDRLFLTGLTLCNDAVLDTDSRLGDPTELALLDLAGRFGLSRPALEQDQPRIGEIAFDSGRKMMTTCTAGTAAPFPIPKGLPMRSCGGVTPFC